MVQPPPSHKISMPASLGATYKYLDQSSTGRYSRCGDRMQREPDARMQRPGPGVHRRRRPYIAIKRRQYVKVYHPLCRLHTTTHVRISPAPTARATGRARVDKSLTVNNSVRRTCRSERIWNGV